MGAKRRPRPPKRLPAAPESKPVPSGSMSERGRIMDRNTVIWGISFPLLLFFIAVGIGTAFAMTSSDSAGFMVAKACFVAAAFDVVAVAIYWVLATQQNTAWSVFIPIVAALIVVPGVILSLQWLSNIEIQLSTRLFPGNDPTPVIQNLRKPIPENALKVFYGRNVAWATKMPLTILNMAGDKMIEVNRNVARDELVVSSLKIFDDRNNIIARMDADDGFWVENSTRKKRPDKSTLKVYDHTDKEVLSLRFLNRSTVSITGVFRHGRVARPVIITPDFMDASGVRMTGNTHAEPPTIIFIEADK